MLHLFLSGGNVSFSPVWHKAANLRQKICERAGKRSWWCKAERRHKRSLALTICSSRCSFDDRCSYTPLNGCQWGYTINTMSNNQLFVESWLFSYADDTGRGTAHISHVFNNHQPTQGVNTRASFSLVCFAPEMRVISIKFAPVVWDISIWAISLSPLAISKKLGVSRSGKISSTS